MCELSEMGRTFSAVVTSSTVTCTVSAVSISQAERESPVRLLWGKSNVSDSTNFSMIESSTGNDQKGMIYMVFICNPIDNLPAKVYNKCLYSCKDHSYAYPVYIGII